MDTPPALGDRCTCDPAAAAAALLSPVVGPPSHLLWNIKWTYFPIVLVAAMVELWVALGEAGGHYHVPERMVAPSDLLPSPCHQYHNMSRLLALLYVCV